jgi:hypothetical protein
MSAEKVSKIDSILEKFFIADLESEKLFWQHLNK